MFKRILYLLFVVATVNAYGQPELEQKIINTKHGREHLRLSLLTCTTGSDVTEWAGHSAIRLVDSTKTDESRDVVYNFGIFSFDESEFPRRFILGDVDVILEVAPFSFFMRAYGTEGRGITEAVLLLNDSEKNSIIDALSINALPANRRYNYDFAFDNCTTRIRDLFVKVLGSKLVLGNAAPGQQIKTYRHICSEYTQSNPLFRFVGGVFLAHDADKVLDNSSSISVPSYLLRSFERGTIDGGRLCSDPATILPGKTAGAATPDFVNIAVLIVALLTVAGLLIPRLQRVGTMMTYIVLLVSGLFGMTLLYTWLGGVHDVCRNNYNILWLLPVNVVVPFFNTRVKKWYAIGAISLLGAALIIHLLGVQVLPLKQLWPLIVALIFIYVRMLRRAPLHSMLAS